MRRFISILLIIVFLLGGAVITLRSLVFPIRDKATIESYSKKYNVKPELVAAIIDFESNFEAIPYKENQNSGLMKLSETTAKNLANEINLPNFKAEDISNDDISIELGTYYLSKSNGDNLKETVGNWAIRNGNEDLGNSTLKDYAENNYTNKIKWSEKFYKILYFL